MKKKKFNKLTYVGYGMTDLFGSGAFAVISAWYMIFLTTYAGLSATQAASIFAISRILDAGLNPIMGMISDKFGMTRLGRRFGRRRFFLLLAIPLVPIYAALWVTDMPYLYYLLMIIAIETVATMVLIPWETLPTEMTTDFNSRSYMANWRFIWAGLAYTLANFIPGQLFKYLGEHDPDVFFYNAIIFSIIFAIAFLVTYLCTWERSDIDETCNIEEVSRLNIDKSKKGVAWQLIKSTIYESFSTLKIRAWRQHLVIYISSFTALDLFGGIFVFWVLYSLNLNKVVVADSMALGGFISLPLGFLSAWFLIKLGPRKMFTICYGVVLLSIIIITLLSYTDFDSTMMTTIISITTVFFVVFKGPLYFLPWSLYSFIPDVDEVVTKQRREGTYAGFMTLMRKFTQALSMMLLGVLLDLGGLVKNSSAQPESLNTMMAWILCVGVVGGLFVALFTVFKYNLNKHTHSILISEIDRLKSGGSMADVTDESRTVVEDLTGYKYEEVWGNNTLFVDHSENIQEKVELKTI
ncbi:MFS transporter [Vibrio artabrorum]|uniref:MFS transporter n=1 Tax=Vibrio artabrorum TaxID=446374 RepID=A0ABT8CLG8_9VIBR|nr:MFS transporter [Vibrio artabrorum]MDN3702288.1 MFS transporter [Vibrio artabrorum]